MTDPRIGGDESPHQNFCKAYYNCTYEVHIRVTHDTLEATTVAQMARLNLSLPERQRASLHAEAERLGISVGELVRRIIDSAMREE